MRKLIKFKQKSNIALELYCLTGMQVKYLKL